ncbi:ubiquinol-cytochrome c reductase complex assembly factor 2-like [Glandiceps talaboti]
MAASRYRKFLRLCEQWPIDKTKRGRDVAQHIRDRVAVAFKHGDNSQISNELECDRIYDNLHQINTDYFKNKYPRLYDTTATGCTLDECRLLVATDSIKQMEDYDKGYLHKMKDSVIKNNNETR